MQKLIFSINITPDGFCDHRAVIADDELHRYSSELLSEASTLVFGRNTFELFKKHWPTLAQNNTDTSAETEFAHQVDRIEKIVFSKTLKEPGWQHTRVSDSPATELPALKKNSSGNILLLGSPGLATSLMELNLIDEYHFCIQPMLAGQGNRFFTEGVLKKHKSLELVTTRAFTSGVVLQHYRRGH